MRGTFVGGAGRSGPQLAECLEHYSPLNIAPEQYLFLPVAQSGVAQHASPFLGTSIIVRDHDVVCPSASLGEVA